MKTHPTRLYLIRHGEVEERYQKIFGGRIDMDLSETGHRQARVLADYLKTAPIDVAYASPMRRVQQTFAPYVVSGGHGPRILHDLREVDFGDWTGFGWEEVREKFGKRASDWLELLEAGGIPNAETAHGYRARVQPCLRHVLAEHPAENVAVFCHGGIVRQLLSIMLELPLSRMKMFEIDYASVTVVDWEPDHVEIQLLNFAPWRDRA
ncbi:MAG: histidine phosphatase family protein [Verrucomicrobia bacterium]|nr:histidine phosphatase family protein [Verrucomicrobiota bacterium]MBI3869218.1 histidine phosphatase family protein [Verrucomicrobiota bacterium]